MQARLPASAGPWGGLVGALPSGSRWADASPTSTPLAGASFSLLESTEVPRTPLAVVTETGGAPSTRPATTIRKSTSGLGGEMGSAATRAAPAPARRRWADLAESPMASSTPQLFSALRSPVSSLGPQALQSPVSSLGPQVLRSPVSSMALRSPTASMGPPPLCSPVSSLGPQALASPQAAAPPRTLGAMVGARRRWADLGDTPLASPAAEVSGRGWSFHINSNNASPIGSELPSPQESDEESPGQEPSRRARIAYPTTPLGRSALPAQRDVAKGNEPRIGIDIGGVLTREGDPTIDRNAEWGLSWEAPGAFNVIWQIVQVFGASNVFLVSKVRPGSSMQMQIEHWLHETCKFCEITGVPKDNIIFVRSMNGPDGKGNMASKLGLSHFVDDKMECLVSVWSDDCGNSGDVVKRFDGVLFHFARGGFGGNPPSLRYSNVSMPAAMNNHYCGVANWAEVQQQLRMRLPGRLQKKGMELLLPENFMTIDPSLQRGIAKPLFASAARAAEEKPPWMKDGSSPRALSARPANSQSAMVKTDGGRPKLRLKPRTIDTGPASEVVQAMSPTANRAQSARPVMVSPTNAARVIGTSLASTTTTVVASSTGPTASLGAQTLSSKPGPALRSDPAGGRPKLVLKPRTGPKTVDAFLNELNQKLRS